MADQDAYRGTLPNRRPTHPTTTPEDVRDAGDPPQIQRTTAPTQAPNVLMVMIDDMGFAASSSFGGPCEMPTADRLAEGGLRFTRFHTTAMCSPTRAALLTGRNHHQVGMAAVTEIATGFPGANSARPRSAAPLAEVLRLNGYSTAAFGKWHQTPRWELSQSGPFDHWPTGEGFEHFYGFQGGETDQFNPTLYDGTTPIERPDEADYHLSQDLADKVINYVRGQRAVTPDKPFFTYLAFGATHAPHQAPAEYLDRYAGRFDDGWDRQREAILERQRDMGIVPEDCELSRRPDEIPAWDDLDDDRKTLFRRMMEVYAAAATHTDDQMGRIIDALDEIGALDNTLVLYLLGDNGASGEGGPDGCLNEYTAYNLVQETIEEMLAQYDDIGTSKTFNHYPVGWAHAMDTPYQWTKQVASHWGGTRNGMIVHWPDGIEASNELRSQFTHVIDIVPTILDIAGLPEPAEVHGVDQIPLPGYGFSYAFDDADAPERHTTQYFELVGNRGIYHDGWSACTIHNVPWDLGTATKTFAEDDWELYAPDDYSQAHNIAADNPEQLEKLHRLFLIEAAKNNVFPLDDRKAIRLDPEVSNRPDLMVGVTDMNLYPGMLHLYEGSVVDVKNRSHTVTGWVEVDDAADGAIVAQGGAFGGWALHMVQGRPAYTYNWVGREVYSFQADQPVTAGRHEIRLEFDYDGGGTGKGADARLLVDGDQVAAGRIDNTCGYMFATSDAMDIGLDTGSPVSTTYADRQGRFSGKIEKVYIDTDPEHHSDPQGQAASVMRRQ